MLDESRVGENGALDQSERSTSTGVEWSVKELLYSLDNLINCSLLALGYSIFAVRSARRYNCAQLLRFASWQWLDQVARVRVGGKWGRELWAGHSAHWLNDQNWRVSSWLVKHLFISLAQKAHASRNLLRMLCRGSVYTQLHHTNALTQPLRTIRVADDHTTGS